MEMRGALTRVLPGHCGGNTRALIALYRQKGPAGENSCGFTNEQSRQGGAFSRDLLDQNIGQSVTLNIECDFSWYSKI